MYEMPRFLSGTRMCKVRDFRFGRDLVRACSVEGVTPLKTQKYLSSRTRSCWNWVSSDTDTSDQSKCKRILEMRGQLWVSLVSSSWKLVTCQIKSNRPTISLESCLYTNISQQCFSNCFCQIPLWKRHKCPSGHFN